MRRIVFVVCVMAVLGASASTAIVYTSHTGFTPWSVARLAVPQVAVGDFDGDGRSDIARIGSHSAERRDVSVLLSSSQSDAIELEGAVSALVEGDIDHDGDLDLLATTASGGLLVWLNDGHGRFTRQPSSPGRSLNGESTVGSASTTILATTLTRAPGLTARVDALRAMVSQARRPPTVLVLPARTRLLLPPLRAPPSAL